MKRVFLAVNISDAARGITAAYVNDLRTEFPAANVNWVRPENLHITIRFLGEIEDDRIDEVKRAAAAAAAESHPIKLRFDKPGSFGERVLYISLFDETSGLPALHKELETRLEAFGFEREKRPFRSHLTIARIRSSKGIQPLLDLHRSGVVEHTEFVITELIVFESTLSPTGSKYTELGRFLFVA